MKKLVWCLLLPSACFEDSGGSTGASASLTTTSESTTSTSRTDTGASASSTASTTAPDLTTGSSSGTGGTSTTGPTPTTGDTTTTTTTATDASSSSGGADPVCLAVTVPCMDTAQCCADLQCGTTTLGQVCCGLAGASCVTANGEDCCGALLCVDGACE